MASIITVTPNTSVDHIVELERIYPSKVLRSDAMRIFPAGKGVNASRALSCLKRKSLCTGFVSSQFADLFEFNESGYMRSAFTRVVGEERCNITLFEKRTELTTHITSPGFSVNAHDLENFYETLRSVVTSDAVVLIAGSLPAGCGSYGDIIRFVSGIGARVIVDASREYIADCVSACPYMLKPNLEELEWISGTAFDAGDHLAIVCACRELLCRGIEAIAVSLGAEGLIYISQASGHYYYHVCLPEDIRCVSHSTVGAGDCVAAALCVGVAEGDCPENFLKNAIALSAANMYAPGPGVCPEEEFFRLLRHVELCCVKA